MPDNNVYDTVVNQGLQIGAQLMLRGMEKGEQKDNAEKFSKLASDIVGRILPAKASGAMDENAALKATIDAGKTYGLDSIESTTLLNNIFGVASKMKEDGADLKEALDEFKMAREAQQYALGEMTMLEKEAGFEKRSEERIEKMPEYQQAEGEFKDFQKARGELRGLLSQALAKINEEDKEDRSGIDENELLAEIPSISGIKDTYSDELKAAIEYIKKNSDVEGVIDKAMGIIAGPYMETLKSFKKSRGSKTGKESVASEALSIFAPKINVFGK